MTTPHPRRHLHQILGRTISYILNDCRTILRVWEDKRDWIDNPEDMILGKQCGGGQFLILQGLLSALNLMAKTYARLQHGENGFKSRRTNGEITKLIETDETMAFTKLVVALDGRVPLGLTARDAATIWKSFRHPLAHLGSPHYSVRIGGPEIAFERNEEGQWECTAEALHRCVELIQQWLWKQVKLQSDERIQDTLDWLLLALDADAKKVETMSFELHEAENVVEELAFEFFHFRLFRSMIRSRQPQGQSQAVLYAFLVHLRIILDFFYMSPKQDDIGIQHVEALLPSFKNRMANPNSLSAHDAKTLKDALNKKLVHLTGARWRMKNNDFDFYERFIDRIEADIESFEKALPPDLRSTYDKSLLQKYELYRVDKAR